MSAGLKEVSALIADDEPLARKKLRDLMAGVDWLQCLGEAADGEAALHAIDTLRPDLLFLDVEMPGLSGLQVIERARHKPIVVFTTAFDRYAVAAFELHALDYLLKPFGRERFLQALERAREALGQADETTAQRLRDAIGPGQRLRRMFVRFRGRVVPLAVDEIERLEAQDDYVAVHTGAHQHLLHVPLADLEKRLDADRFVRIHRSHIVNLDFVSALVPHEGGRIEVAMRGGARIMASRARSRELRNRAGGVKGT